MRQCFVGDGGRTFADRGQQKNVCPGVVFRHFGAWHRPHPVYRRANSPLGTSRKDRWPHHPERRSPSHTMCCFEHIGRTLAQAQGPNREYS